MDTYDTYIGGLKTYFKGWTVQDIERDDNGGIAFTFRSPNDDKMFRVIVESYDEYVGERVIVFDANGVATSASP